MARNRPRRRDAAVAAVTTARAVRITDETGAHWSVAPTTDGGLVEGSGGVVRLLSGDGRRIDAWIRDAEPNLDGSRTIEVTVEGWLFSFTIDDDERAALRDRATRGAPGGTRHGHFEVRSVIPGRVVAVDVLEGGIVSSGDRLLVVEAMKMQNEIRAPHDGTVVRVAVGVGGTVEIGSILVVLG
jgi:biotin carboxyl carrier protein